MSNDCNALFSFKALFFKREFKGQSSGPHIGDKLISGNELATVMDTVYESCEEHLQREVIFNMIGNNREVIWSQNIRPEKSDIHKYILFQDKSAKKTLKWTQITTNVLTSWRGKDIGVLIHIHSLSLSSSSDFEIAKTRLMQPAERDRSGAASLEVVNLLAKRLQNTHPYDGEPITFKIWANYILSCDPAEQEDLIYRLPPSYIADNLRIRMPNHPQMSLAHNRMSIAHNVNRGYHEGILELRRTYNTMIDVLKVMDMKIKSMEDRYNMGDGLLSEMVQDLNPTESSHSINLAASVQDALDVDHT